MTRKSNDERNRKRSGIDGTDGWGDICRKGEIYTEDTNI